ncbi:hypothetical protein M902_1856 [Bacteriovorax sp. BAL6_X]|uniref:hypothetical protein n=1 Tax=Bacteriovorax sp. BAL6_X TaxID=1201290 RepID=UPI000386ACC0|nr:hypothetical protein [Bacteriovorax sp. BAL6_X]EPZ52408.1 hypothetical protein M902_1856 [Bacteriovorax sp. BAL6_X]
MEVMEKGVDLFNEATRGSTDYYKDNVYIMKKKGEYAPLSFMKKKVEGFDEESLLSRGFIYDSLELVGDKEFLEWYEKQFSRKMKRTHAKQVLIIHLPDNKRIFDAIETVNKVYDILRDERIIFNGKKLPVQLGEWYAKCIFGLMQKKSTSQRGFDFYVGEKRIEVVVHWGDQTSPKGVKVRKSLCDLSASVIIIYLARNFMIRDICLLDSDYVLRKFAGKGHTLFLKDSDIGTYFFSKSTKHKDKVVNKNALLKYALPKLAMNLTEFLEG